MNYDQALPTREDFEAGGSHFAWSACDDFLGKSLAEAQIMFGQNSLVRGLDLSDMGSAAFRFYVQAAIAYVRSEEAVGDSDAINFLAGTLQRRLKADPTELAPIASVLADGCSYVSSHLDRFDANPEIYGDLRGRYASLITSFQALAPGRSRSA